MNVWRPERRGDGRPSVLTSGDLSGEVHVQVYQVGDCSTDWTCSRERSVVRCFDKALVQLFQVENCAWRRHQAAPGLEGQPTGGAFAAGRSAWTISGNG